MAEKQVAHKNLRHGSDRKLLTEEQVDRAVALWPSHTLAEVAEELGVGIDRLRARLNDQLSCLERRGRGVRPPNKPASAYFESTRDPTPDEIRVRSAEVRRAWGPERFLPGHIPEDRRYGRAHDNF